MVHDRLAPQKKIHFSPSHFFNDQKNGMVARVFKRDGQILVFVPRSYHGGSGTGYNNTKATSFANFHG